MSCVLYPVMSYGYVTQEMLLILLGSQLVMWYLSYLFYIDKVANFSVWSWLMLVEV